MSKRYTKQEISQIQALTQEGHTIKQIADVLGRPEAGIRNIRHRNKLKTKTKKTLEALRKDEKNLTRRVTKLNLDIQTLTLRRQDLQKAINTDEQALETKLQHTLYRMRDEKPELFNITLEDQIVKMASEITGSFLKWILS